MMCGGTGGVKEADEEIQAICNQLKADIDKKGEYTMFKALHYKSQLVAGTNYFVKVAESGECVHVRIFKPLPCNPDEVMSLHGLQEGKVVGDALEHF